MKNKIVLKQWLNLHDVSRKHLIFIGHSDEKFVVPKTEYELLNFISSPKTELEIKEWLILNKKKWSYEDLIKTGLTTNHFIDKTKPDSRDEAFYNLIEDDQLTQKIKEKTIFLIGTGGIGSNLAQTFSRLNIKRIIILDDDVVEPSNLNRQVFFDYEDIGKYKVDVVEEKIKKYSKTEIIKINQKVNSEQDLEKIKNQYQIDFVVLSADSTFLLMIWCYRVFSKNNIPFTSTGYQNTFMMTGPILDRENKAFEIGVNRPSEDIEFMDTDFKNQIIPSTQLANSFISSYTAIEMIKYWTKKWKPKTLNQRIIIDALTWIEHKFPLDVEE